MSRPFFWIVFLCALVLSVFLAVAMPHDAIPLLLVALVWIVTAALAWNRWVASDTNWLGRAAAAVGASMIGVTVYQWLHQTDVFAVASQCDKRTGTFWPLLFIWLIGAGLFCYALFGKLPGLKELTRPALRPLIWWIAALAWTAVCGYVFANNLSLDVFIESMRMAGYVAGGIALFVGGITGIALLFSLPERRRQKQAAADLAHIDAAARQEILDLIDRHARQGEFFLLYRSVEHGSGDAAAARIGGDPLAAAGETWPLNSDGSPALFLLQLPLTAPRHPAQWQNRIVTVFLVEHGLLVRSHAAASIPHLLPLSNPLAGTEVVRQDLLPLAIPYVPNPAGAEEDEEEEDEAGGFDTAQLLAQIPELKSRLELSTRFPLHVLNQIIAGKAHCASEDLILSGGDPQLIQGEHEPCCPVCGQPMRFLFQFGDVTESFELGDCGVGYIYGCDAHPEQCEGYVDCF